MPSSTIFAVETLEVNGIAIAIQRKSIKNINLRVHSDGRVSISAPVHADPKRIRQFAESKLEWIKKKQAECQARQGFIPRQYFPGETHYFRGQPYCLHIHLTSGKQRVELQDSDGLHLYVRSPATGENCERVLYGWYRQQLGEIAPALVKKWEPIMGVRINEVRFKRMKTRWGTCNIQKRRVWLNTELMRSPPHCLEYVVVHEMVHLLERLHNDRFHRLLGQFLPTYKIAEQDLKHINLA
ncbi:MAG: SprT family zinc-dependent metalloprotease [Cyanobacteria bacterium P01_C01_bin.89]